LKGKEITVRTLDAGGEKMLHYYDQEGDPNPELGLRSTRFLLAHPEVFDHQLRALLLAAADEGVTLRILFPMIGSPEEFRAAKARLLACREALQAETGAALAEPRIGMMIELPAIAETLDLFLDDVAFFSIGTNDFVQYMLGADRTNQRVAAYYTPHHPAVLRSLHRIADTLVRAGREVTVCGELAHNERFVPFLVGIGIRRLSVDPGRLPGVQGRIASFSLAEAEALAARALACRSVEAAAAVLGCETASVAGAD
jgi:phosphotransferase system enzyme I (PtsP)